MGNNSKTIKVANNSKNNNWLRLSIVGIWENKGGFYIHISTHPYNHTHINTDVCT